MFILIDVTRGFSTNFLRETLVEENWLRSALQCVHVSAVSGDDALQREQVCTAWLLIEIDFIYFTL